MTLDLEELRKKAENAPTEHYEWAAIVLALIGRVRKAETALKAIRDDGLSRDDARDEARKALA